MRRAQAPFHPAIHHTKSYQIRVRARYIWVSCSCFDPSSRKRKPSYKKSGYAIQILIHNKNHQMLGMKPEIIINPIFSVKDSILHSCLAWVPFDHPDHSCAVWPCKFSALLWVVKLLKPSRSLFTFLYFRRCINYLLTKSGNVTR